MSDDLLSELITALRFLPGVGKKTAQRMALHLLERNREGGDKLGQLLQQSMSDIGHCQRCRNFTTQPVCGLCQNPRRTNNQLCVVETPADLWAVEQAGSYSGHYFVLMGNLSPLDGIGPDDLGVDELVARVKALSCELDEVILATNPTVEGDATAYYLGDLLRAEGVKVSRIAHGIPVGGELEYTDSSTLAHAMADRKVFE